MLKEHFCDMLCNVPRKLWLYGNTGQNIPILERKGLGGIFSLTFPSKPYVSRGFFRKVRHVEPAQSHPAELCSGDVQIISLSCPRMSNAIPKRSHLAAAQGEDSISSSVEESTVLNPSQQSSITSKVMC